MATKEHARSRQTPRDRKSSGGKDSSERRGNAGPKPSKREHKVAGQNACRALFERRPHDIRRVYVTDETMRPFGDVLSWCAANHIAYHKKTSQDLDQIAETVHHDNVVFIARAKEPARPADVVSWAMRQKDRAVLVLLENVKNPHNLGAILRVCAHFGVRALLAAGETPPLSPAAMRTAEGGAEHCDVVPCGSGLEICETLRAAGFKIMATSSHATTSIAEADLPARAVVLFGSEKEGLSKKLAAKADIHVVIPGSGSLESLNVATAASVVLWELWKRGAP